MKKIGILIPATSKNRDEWVNIFDSYLYKYTVKTFIFTLTKGYNYVFYIGYDKDDRIYSLSQSKKELKKLGGNYGNISFKFIELNEQKGYLTKMWNILFNQAYNDKCDYFFQCGDDIEFTTKEWIKECIIELKKNNDIGMAGPLNNNNRILTQAMFSRKHMEIFSFLFPEEIINWCCDDWYNYLYSPKYIYILKNHLCNNKGGAERYTINNDDNFNMNEKLNNLRKFAFNLAEKHKMILNSYLFKN
jgi:hypothetical protein